MPISPIFLHYYISAKMAFWTRPTQAFSVLWVFCFIDLFFFSASSYKTFGLLQTFIDLAYIELLSGEKLLPTTDTDVQDLAIVR